MNFSGKRHAARELALKMLYQVDIGQTPVEEVLAEFEPDEEIGETPEGAISFAHSLVEGTARNIKTIDRLLASQAEEWAFERLASVDRNVLRMAIFEMLLDKRTPEEIVINEAVELAKAYGSEESGKFVNGILGALSRQRAAGALKIEAPEEEAEAGKKRKRKPLRMGPES
jgi:N utilization substance protein B